MPNRSQQERATKRLGLHQKPEITRQGEEVVTTVETYICQAIIDLRLRSAINAERLATSKENATLNSYSRRGRPRAR